MRTLLVILLLIARISTVLAAGIAGGGMMPKWQPWMLSKCVFAWDSAYGVSGTITLRDMSGQNGTGRDMTAASHQPSQVLSRRNGWPAIVYTNQTMWLSCATPFTVTNNNTIVVAAKCYGLETTNINIFVANWQTNNQQFKINANGIPTAFATGNTTGAIGSSWSGMTTNWFCGVFNNASSTITFRTNSVSAGGATGDTVGNTVASSIGNVLNPNIFLTADVGLIIGFSPALTASELAEVEAYCSTRWKMGF